MEATSIPAGVGVGCKGIINPDSTVVEVLPGTLHYLEGLALERSGCAAGGGPGVRR